MCWARDYSQQLGRVESITTSHSHPKHDLFEASLYNLHLRVQRFGLRSGVTIWSFCPRIRSCGSLCQACKTRIPCRHEHLHYTFDSFLHSVTVIRDKQITTRTFQLPIAPNTTHLNTLNLGWAEEEGDNEVRCQILKEIDDAGCHSSRLKLVLHQGQGGLKFEWLPVHQIRNPPRVLVVTGKLVKYTRVYFNHGISATPVWQF